MPFSLRADPGFHLIAVHFFGTLTEQGVIEAARAVAAHPDVRQGMAVLWDGTGIQELLLEIGYEHRLIEAAARLRDAIGPHKDVFLTRREVGYLAVKLYAMYARRKGWETVVVRSMEEALDALGLKEPPDWLGPGTNR